MQSIPVRRPYAQFSLFALFALLLASFSASLPKTTPGRFAAGVSVASLTSRVAPVAVNVAQTNLSWATPTSPADAFAELEARASGPLAVSWDRVTGVPSWLAAKDYAGRLPYTPTAAEAGNPTAIARGFLDQNRALFGLRSVSDELTLLRVEPDLQRGFAHVRFEQVYQGLPVFGRQIVLHLDPQQRIVAVNGRFVPHIDVAPQPMIDARRAEAVAVRSLLEQQLDPHDAKRANPVVLKDKSRLVVYVGVDGHAGLAWEVHVVTYAPLGDWSFFVNARRPAINHVIETTENAKRRQTYTAGGTTDIPGQLLIDEGERSSRDPIAQAAHDGAGTVYDYYFNTFKRDSLDGQGMEMISTVHFGSDPQDQENAAWIGDVGQMIYGDGGRIFKPLPYGLDVVGHEFTHGVVQSTADLVYESQAGALNESYADVFGALIDRGNWTVGEKVVKSPPFPLPYLRSLSDPNANGSYDPRDPLSGIGQPATADEYANLPVSRRADNGGVHINSGITNHAAYLVAQAIGSEKMEQIYYRTMTQYLQPRSDFFEAANATARAAADLYSTAEVNAVRTAFAQVGLDIGGNDTTPAPPAQPGQPNPNTPPPPDQQVPAGCTELITSGDFESDQGWQQVTAKGSAAIIDPELPRTGERSAWLGGTDEESFMYIYQDVRVPSNATRTQLTYYRNLHRELSGGLASLIAGEAKFDIVLANTQGDTLASLEELDSSQADDAWQQRQFDLSTYAGKTVRVVFSAENPPSNVSSMFVDDVSLLGCTGGSGPAAPSTSAGQVYFGGTITDSATGRGINGAQIFVMRPGVSASQAAADNNISEDEVITLATTDRNGTYRTEQPVSAGQTYSVIVIASGYRPIIADDGVEVPSNAENPFPVDAELRRGW